MSSRRSCAVAVSISLLLLLSSLSMSAQSTYGSITGTVTDASGAAVTDATVTLTNMGTAEKRSQNSGADGLFTFVNLFAGQYKIDVEKQGFKHFTRHAVRRGQPGCGSNLGSAVASGRDLIAGHGRGHARSQRASAERPQYFQPD